MAEEERKKKIQWPRPLTMNSTSLHLSLFFFLNKIIQLKNHRTRIENENEQILLKINIDHYRGRSCSLNGLIHWRLLLCSTLDVFNFKLMIES